MSLAFHRPRSSTPPSPLARLAGALLMVSVPAGPAGAFEPDWRPLIESHCLDCHGPELPRPKGMMQKVQR